MGAACGPEESRLFRFFLYSGFREQEATYFTWKDLGASTAAVRHKPQYGWSPKSLQGTHCAHTGRVCRRVADGQARGRPGE